MISNEKMHELDDLLQADLQFDNEKTKFGWEVRAFYHRNLAVFLWPDVFVDAPDSIEIIMHDSLEVKPGDYSKSCFYFGSAANLNEAALRAHLLYTAGSETSNTAWTSQAEERMYVINKIRQRFHFECAEKVKEIVK